MATATLTARVESVGVRRATDELHGLERQADRTETATEQLDRESQELTRTLQVQSRASRTASRTLGGLGSSVLSTIGNMTLLSGGVIGITAAFIGLAANIDSLKSELIILADLSDTSVQEFQKLSTAFKTVNVDADKTADILKDVNDKVGQFVLSGGGEFKEVFEKVLKPLGRTREELTELGPGGILLAVAEGMEQLGFDGTEVTAIMEALANDSTKLIPLLENNGAALKEISLEIESKGLLLTDSEVQALRDANTELSKMASLFSNVFTKTKGILAKFLFGDDFPSTIEGVNTEIEALRVKIKELQTDQGIFNFGDDKDIVQAQIRIGDLIASRQRLLNVERQAREETEKAAFREETGKERRAAEFAAEQKAEEEKRELKRQTEEQKLTDDLARQAEADIRAQDRLDRELERERDAAQRRTDLILQLNETERQTIERIRLERLEQLEKDFATRLALEQENLANRLALEKNFQQAKLEIEKKAKIANENIDEKAAKVKEEETQKLIGKITGLMQSGNEELFRIGQAAALANAVVETASAVSKALGSAPPPLNFLLAIAAGAAGAAQVAAIASAPPPSARQQGGQFQAGQRLMVGEQGPELVEFGTGGRIADTRGTKQITENNPPIPEIIIINQTSEEISEPDISVDEDQKVTILIRNTVSSDLENSNSKISKSLGRATTAGRQF